jgi:hypothetical protein
MIRNLLGSCILSLVVGVAFAQGSASSSGTSPRYTKAELKQMESTAHTAGQYNKLAAFYGAQHEGFVQKAAEAKQEWERRSQNVAGNNAKYPRPMDSARNYYEYYMHKASETAELEAKYSQLASTDALAQR